MQRRPDSFAEQQIKYAKEEMEFTLDIGQSTFQCVQVCTMLTWFYWCQGRWSEAFMSAGQSLRICIPCGLNVCPPFHTIAESFRPPSIIPPAKTVVEDEMRRNTFWIAYAMERQMGSGNGWALSLDDQDICQLLPLRGDQYEQGILVYPSERQWSHDRDVIANHREGQLDSFIMYIKVTILLSKVKTFNLRFKWKHYTGDASVISPTNSPSDNPNVIDIKEAPAFRELEETVAKLKASWPIHLKNPIDGHAVDPYLYVACMIPHLCSILLNEPHARPSNVSCLHADKMLKGARAIVEMIYRIDATSYDVSLLGLHAIMCWFMAARVLVRFLKAAIDAESEPQMNALQDEIAYVRSMIDKGTRRLPLADRYKRMLEEFLLSTCGRQFIDTVPPLQAGSQYGTTTDPKIFEPTRNTLDMFLQYKAPQVHPMSAATMQTMRS